jgi:hypothetical protein
MDSNLSNTTPTIEKILINFSEFERLKTIEKQFIELQKSKAKELEIHEKGKKKY